MTTLNESARLVDLIEEFVSGDGFQKTPIPFLKLVRFSKPQQVAHALMQPAFVLPAQGKKRVYLADSSYDYDPLHYLLVSVDLPVSGEVIEASSKKPYLSIFLELNIDEIALVAKEAKFESGTLSKNKSGLFVSAIENNLLESCVRLLKLLKSPEDIPVLAPLIKKEIIYHLLRGKQKELLGYMIASKGNHQKIEEVVNWIKGNYSEKMDVERLARKFKMSTSSLHHSFKAVTQMSPLQYQKTIRLMEARKLLLGGSTNAAAVGFQVGYESPSQFSREYRRLFGRPPREDTQI